MPKRGHFSRSRCLEDFNKRFSKDSVQKIIRSAIRQSKDGTVRVLEIGCGEGRVLMELCRLFPSIELHGINKAPWPAMKGRQSLRRTATYYNIFKKSELSKIILPKIQFYDASELKFKDAYFDLIISQVAIPYVERKDRLLEECWRVLKRDGKALLHIDSLRPDNPDFLQTKIPRFVIYRKRKRVDLKSIISEKKRAGYSIRLKSVRREDGVEKYNIILKKNNSKPLRLGLEFDEVSSFNIYPLDKEHRYSDIFWGYRSVFRIK